MEASSSIISACGPMAKTLATLDRLAVMDKKTVRPCNVLIQGETGTGKELVARRIHAESGREGQPFIAVNCSAMPADLFESELFGHEKGAFTGAHVQKKGLLEKASGGTLFLDEIADLPVPLQVKLLRALQQGTVRHVGGLKEVETDVRIVAASNRDLTELVRGGSFRRDLLYRLSVFTVTLPSLRERPEDVRLLVAHFCERFAEKYGAARKRFTDAAIAALARHPWPGNVRELEHFVERAYIMCLEDEVGMEAIPADIAALPPADEAVPEVPSSDHGIGEWVAGLPDDMTFEAFSALQRDAKRLFCERRLEFCGGNASRTAASLGIDRSYLRKVLLK